ncbi:DUF637 domain-containing protein [Pseudomonas sp. SBB6]|uniref:DUF637 domain-containing protein n=1 Tax=Pseudomonas sp. SBB6 TaxID=2962032 RepID=UPI00349F5D9F
MSSGISTAVNGGSFGDNLGSALVGEASTIAMATGFNFVGNRTIKFDNGSVPKIFAHALMGGLLAEATGSDFKTGAMAAGLNEAMSNRLAAVARGNDNVHVMLSQLTGVVAETAVDGDLGVGSEIAQSRTIYNYLYHREILEIQRVIDAQKTEAWRLEVQERYAELDARRSDESGALCQKSLAQCEVIAKRLISEKPEISQLVDEQKRKGVNEGVMSGYIITSSG